MVLDPITALGIASNGLQFVDFACRLVSNSLDLYRNSNLVHHVHLREQAKQLQEFITQLESDIPQISDGSSASYVIRNQHGISEDQDGRFRALLEGALQNTKQCARELLDTISKLTPTGPHAKWQSFRHALSSIMGERGLEEAAQRLWDARQHLILFLVLYTR
jgi:hypothetical protein